MDDLKYWVALSKVCYGNADFILKLVDYFESAKEAWFASPADVENYRLLCGRQTTFDNFFDKKKSENVDAIFEDIQKKDIQILTINDEKYPALLKQIYNPPAVLYVKGNLDECNLNNTLAVVGSRKASHYIEEILTKIISDLKGNDITIVSGLALGVDACAHEAALSSNLKTIGVLGCGFDNVYPAKNKKMYQQIISGNGAVISEYYPSELPDTWKFPKRNRIVTGLSKGTLVAEAALKSGALISARLCAEQDREVMCIPGLITNPNTAGVHKLIKDGAAVVTEAQDIFECLNWHRLNSDDVENISENNSKIYELLTEEEKKVYNVLSLEPVSIDNIINQFNNTIDVNDLMVTLTTLELKDIIKKLPGEKYIKVL